MSFSNKIWIKPTPRMCLKQVLQVGKLAKKGQRVGKTA